MTQSDDVIERRRRIWLAMSALWLDNELQDFELAHIARVIREEGVSAAEADGIFTTELAPVLGWNHLTVAGVWDGFDPDWLYEKAERRLRRTSWLARFAAGIGLTTYAARPSWRRVKQLAFDPDWEDIQRPSG